jgi:hypothetical protein
MQQLGWMRHLREGWCEEPAKARIADCNVPSKGEWVRG